MGGPVTLLMKPFEPCVFNSASKIEAHRGERDPNKRAGALRMDVFMNASHRKIGPGFNQKPGAQYSRDVRTSASAFAQWVYK